MKAIRTLYAIFIFSFYRSKKIPLSLSQAQRLRGFPRIFNKGRIQLGQGISLNSGLTRNPIGGQDYLLLVTEPGGQILIGDGSGISNSTIVSWQSIEIGRNVFIGGDCRIYDTDFHPLELGPRLSGRQGTKVKPVRIMDGAFIGAGTIILKGSTIGESSVIGAGSVVSGTIPGGQIWAGNPARFIKEV